MSRLAAIGINIPTIITWIMLALTFLFQVYGFYFKLNDHLADHEVHLSTKEQIQIHDLKQELGYHKIVGHGNKITKSEIKEIVRQTISELKQDNYFGK